MAAANLDDVNVLRFLVVSGLCFVSAVIWYVAFILSDVVPSPSLHVAFLAAPVPTLAAVGFFASKNSVPIVRGIFAAVCGLLMPPLALYAVFVGGTVFSAASGNFH